MTVDTNASPINLQQGGMPISVIHDTIRTSAAWNSGYQGYLASIGIGDIGAMSTNIGHPALRGKIVESLQNPGNDAHAVSVAGVIAGEDDNWPYKGVAYKSNWLYSAAIYQGNSVETLNQLTWLANKTNVTNASITFEGSQSMHWTDRAFDYISRTLKTFFVVVSGNYDSTFTYNVRSPGKAYNVITVGGFDTQLDSNWSNDQMWDGSCYIDPYKDGSTNSGDREKPEVVAVGQMVEIPDVFTYSYDNSPGTSFAAPQVTGLAALLLDADYDLRNNPPASKAIIMASADHNIEGDRRLSEQDGAGGIDIATAISTFQTGAYTYRVWNNISSIFPNPSPNNYITLTSADMVHGPIYATKGERVRSVITWESNPNSGLSSDMLTSDLDLKIISPSGTTVASSYSNDNNYEIVDFNATETGYYSIRVTYYNRGTESPDIGFGFAWIRIPQIYLPAIMNN